MIGSPFNIVQYLLQRLEYEVGHIGTPKQFWLNALLMQPVTHTGTSGNQTGLLGEGAVP